MTQQFKLDKESKTDLANAILALYKSTRKFNIIAGNKELSKDRLPNQIELVKAELKETNDALKDNDLVEVVKECADLLVTLAELNMIIDKNTEGLNGDDLLKNAPRYLNQQGRNVEQLIGDINYHIEEEEWLDALGATEDLTMQLNADMVHNLKQVALSNLSKFTMVEDLDISEETEFTICEYLNAQRRYENVYSEIVDFNGVEYVVFKSKRDILNEEYYPKGKVIKSPLTFKLPELCVYE